jgi:hemolysin III
MTGQTQQTQTGPDRPEDEHANFITHGLGLLLSIPAAGFLLWLVVPHAPAPMVAACVIYCVSLVGLYAASTLSHAFVAPEWRRFYRTLDQSCIFLLIAGSFTPFAVNFLWYGHWPWLLAAMWILALLGVVMVLYMRDLTEAAKITYLFLGWLPVVSLKVLFDSTPWPTIVWIAAGGACYSLGTIFLRYDRSVRFFHALWHTLVIAGSTCHYFAIVTFVVQT